MNMSNFCSSLTVLDTCVGDVSSPHIHHLFYFCAKAESENFSDLSCGTTSCSASDSVSENNYFNRPLGQFLPFEPARASDASCSSICSICSIWGRTCMEFDVLPGLYELPQNAAVGDFLLVCCTGAYDISMQYNFGDGQERDIRVL